MAVTSWLKAFAPSQVHYGKGPTAKSKIMAFGHCDLFEKIYITAILACRRSLSLCRQGFHI